MKTRTTVPGTRPEGRSKSKGQLHFSYHDILVLSGSIEVVLKNHIDDLGTRYRLLVPLDHRTFGTTPDPRPRRSDLTVYISRTSGKGSTNTGSRVTARLTHNPTTSDGHTSFSVTTFLAEYLRGASPRLRASLRTGQGSTKYEN